MEVILDKAVRVAKYLIQAHLLIGRALTLPELPNIDRPLLRRNPRQPNPLPLLGTPKVPIAPKRNLDLIMQILLIRTERGLRGVFLLPRLLLTAAIIYRSFWATAVVPVRVFGDPR